MDSVFRLRRFLDTPLPRKTSGCELCGATLARDHGHVVDIEQRRLMCACRPCYLLFTHSGAAGGKFRSVPDRVVKLPDAVLHSARWEALDIPVGIAFFLHHSSRGKIVAFYPSPAGATESGLPLETWDELTGTHPVLTTMEPDTEALLVSRRPHKTEAWLLPVDACYELVGRIRRQWTGFDGGPEAWRDIDEFLSGLSQRERSCA